MLSKFFLEIKDNTHFILVISENIPDVYSFVKIPYSYVIIITISW